MKRKPSDKLRDMDTPMVLGCVELDRQTLTPVRRPIPATPAPVVPSTGPMMVIDLPPDPAPESGLLRDIMAISSGTMAGMAKMANIKGEPDAIQEQLILFYLRFYRPENEWEKWIDVWRDFKIWQVIKRASPEQIANLKAWLDREFT